jgi:hypothetical protein
MSKAIDDLQSDLPDDLPVYKPSVAKQPKLWSQKCPQCVNGIFQGASRFGQVCLACNGKGEVFFKTSPEQRAANRQAANQRKSDKLTAKVKDFTEKNPEVVSWIHGRLDRSTFATSLSAQLLQRGFLTDNQVAAVMRMIEADKERAKQVAQSVSTAKSVDVSGIEGLFKKAQVQKPVLRLDAFKFKPAPDTGKYPGAVYVTDANTSEYLGRIHEGKFIKTRSATPEIEQRILEAAASPQEAAVKYGKMTERCSVCGHKLDNPESVERGIGPVCAEKFGW